MLQQQHLRPVISIFTSLKMNLRHSKALILDIYVFKESLWYKILVELRISESVQRYLQLFNPLLVFTNPALVHLYRLPHHRRHLVYFVYVRLHFLQRAEGHSSSMHFTHVSHQQVRCADRGVLLFQLGDDGRVLPLAGHEKPEHLLPVFGHDELQCRLVLLQRRSELCRRRGHKLGPVSYRMSQLAAAVGLEERGSTSVSPLFSCWSSLI